MAIDFKKYVNITSEIGAGTVVATRDLIGRLFTINPLVPVGDVLQFNDATEVKLYFGSSSEEYARALAYFSWISKNDTRPQKISFARWADAAVAPLIYGMPLALTLSQLQAITTGSFNLTLGSISHDITGLNFSAASDFAGVATILQVAIRAADTDNQWDQSTVTYSSGSNAFNFVGGETVADVIAIAAAGSGTDIRASLGWLPSSLLFPFAPIFSDGSLTETITDTLDNSMNLTNNFGSFLFLPELSEDEIVEAATWNVAQNFMFMYTIPTAAADASDLATALEELGGAALTLSETEDEYPEQLPMQIFAATDYTAVNAVQNYMFQQAALTPSVTVTSVSDSYDAIGVNYYGETQTAGQLLAFYQRGILTGVAVNTNPADMNVYANEIWLRDAAGAAVMTLILALPRISANSQGRSQLLATIQSVINLALQNGTISVGTLLSAAQRTYVTEITGDPKAWRQVQNIGYWINAVIVATTFDVNNVPTIQYEAQYTLVYKKDDAIRKVDGSHFLI